ncbi:MAG: T9SS type A sorting domain-containing protein [bacterium]
MKKRFIFSQKMIISMIFTLTFFAQILVAYSQAEFKVKNQLNSDLKDNPAVLKPANLNSIDNSLKWISPVGAEKIDLKTVQNSFDDYWVNKKPGKGSGWKPYKRSEDFWKHRVDADGNVPNVIGLFEELQMRKEADSKKEKLQQENTWKSLGPSSPPQHQSYTDPTGLGRINCVEFNPRNPNIMWAGAAFGGIWKSTDAGNNWKTFPFTEFLSIGISDIAVANTSNTYTNIVYAATGDADAAFGGINCYTIGVIKTTDNGNSWKVTNFAKQISDRVLINRLLVDPMDTNRVYAATSRGLFLTEDGGDTWDTLTNAYTRDLEFRPDDSKWLWASFIYGDATNTFYGLYHVSIIERDGKDSVSFFRGLDFYYGDVVRMAITVNVNNPTYVYIVNVKNGGGLHSVIYTPDAGQQWFYMAQTLDNTIGNYTWDLLNAHSDMPDSISTPSQGFYDLCIASNPSNPMDVYIGGVNLYRFRANGQPWELVGYWTTKYESADIPYIHADHHDLRFSPEGLLFSCNDGGINRYYPATKEWKDLSKGLEVTQFYRIHSYRNDPGLLICGSQDNGTSILKNNQWNYVRGGDGMDCWIDQFDGQVMYSSIYYGDFAVSRNGGNSFSPLLDTNKTNERAEWVAPFAIDPVIPDDIYAGYINLWKAGRKGLDPFTKVTNFTDNETIRHIAISRADHNVIYIIKPQAIWRTTNAGKDWATVVTGNGDLTLTSIAIDPKDALKFWVTRGNFIATDKVFYYDKGLYQYSEGIPNVPVNCIVYNRNSKNNQMFIGTDIGVYFRDDDMEEWAPYGKGLPNVVVQDLDIHEASGKLRAGTFGRGLWEVKIIDCVIAPPEVLLSKSNKICESDSVVLWVVGDYASYEWTTSETSKSITVKETGIYTVTVKDSLGCVSTSEDIAITVIKPPNVTIKNSLNKNSFCEGDSLKLDAGPTLNYEDFEWSDGQIGRYIYVKESGTYTVTGITREGCRKTSSGFVITKIAAPEKPGIIREVNLLTCSVEAKTYTWFLNDEKISFADKREYNAKTSGNYTVMITNESNCSNISDPMYVQIVGVEDETRTNMIINLHPNPTYDKFALEIINNSSNINQLRCLIEIKDIISNTIMKIPEFTLGERYIDEINIKHLPAGLYFVNIQIGNDIYVKKVVKH